MKTIRHILATLLVPVLTGCGIGDQKSEVNTGKAALTCSERAAILQKNESATFHYSLDGQPKEVDPTLDIGDSLRYFNWGNLVQVDPQTVTYTAPAFVPEARRMDLQALPKDASGTQGSCFVHLMDDFTYGVFDDGTVRGLVVSSYQVNTIANLDTLTPREKGVMRDFNITNGPATLLGVSTIAAGNLTFRIKGTITTAAANYWFRFTAPGTNSLYIDGKKIGASGGGVAELPLTNSVAPTFPNYASGIPLTPGKHTIQIDVVYTANQNYKLEWTTTRPTATVKPYTVIPYTAFDRD